jgi:hypothetical protein
METKLLLQLSVVSGDAELAHVGSRLALGNGVFSGGAGGSPEGAGDKEIATTLSGCTALRSNHPRTA